MPVKKGDVLVFDRGYNDYELFSKYGEEGIYFVTRIKSNAVYDIVKNLDTDSYENIGFDQFIKLTGFYAAKDCKHKLRIVES